MCIVLDGWDSTSCSCSWSCSQVDYNVTSGRKKFMRPTDIFPLHFSPQLFPRSGSGLTRHWPLCHHCPTEGGSSHSEEDAASEGSNDFREREEGTAQLVLLRSEWGRQVKYVVQGTMLAVERMFVGYIPLVLWERYPVARLGCLREQLAVCQDRGMALPLSVPFCQVV